MLTTYPYGEAYALEQCLKPGSKCDLHEVIVDPLARWYSSSADGVGLLNGRAGTRKQCGLILRKHRV